MTGAVIAVVILLGIAAAIVGAVLLIVHVLNHADDRRYLVYYVFRTGELPPRRKR